MARVGCLNLRRCTDAHRVIDYLCGVHPLSCHVSIVVRFVLQIVFDIDVAHVFHPNLLPMFYHVELGFVPHHVDVMNYEY